MLLVLDRGDLLTRLTVLSNPAPVLGSFGKGIAGSVSLSFAPSGTANCDKGCRLHPKSTNPLRYAGDFACYAVRGETRGDRAGHARKLARHGNSSPADIVNRARVEVEHLATVPWFRFSTNGALPMPGNIGRQFATALRALLVDLRGRDIPVHMPVETASKARAYRAVVQGLAVVRESAQSFARWTNGTAPMSIVAGTSDQSRLERITTAKHVARQRHEHVGRRAIVCPAITASWYARGAGLTGDRFKARTARAKCGSCCQCANPEVDVVYPLH